MEQPINFKKRGLGFFFSGKARNFMLFFDAINQFIFQAHMNTNKYMFNWE